MADNPERETKPTGDQIGAQIGEGARNVIVGKNVIQIGVLQIPYYLAAIITLCLLIGLGFVAYPSVKPWLPKPLAFSQAAQNETLIVIATFQVTEGNHNTLAQREIRDKIRAKSQELHETNLRAEVEPTVLNADQRAEAETLGKRYGASMVIWGDDTGARVTVNFLNLRQSDFDAASVTISETVRTQLANPSAYAQFITDDLPREMSFFALFAVGQAYFVNTRYASAIQSIEAAVAQLPTGATPAGLADAYFRLGWLYQQQPVQLDQAIANYNKALQLNPADAIAYNNRGVALDDQGEYAAAIADYEQALKLKPDYAFAYNNRGFARHDQGKLDEAIADYNQALKLKPDYAEAYNNRGLARYDQGEYAAAIADYEQALKFKPDYADAYNNRGVALAVQGKLDEAIADYNQALKLKPDYAEAYNNRGVALAVQGKLDEAIANFNQALKLKPDYADAYSNRGRARKVLGKYDEAIADYDQALKLYTKDNDKASVYNSLCWTYSLQQKPQLALPHCQHAVELDPQPWYYDSRGLAYASLGDFKVAIEDFQTSIAWLEKQTDAQSATYLAKRKAWIADLQAGKNPFTPEVLAALRKE